MKGSPEFAFPEISRRRTTSSLPSVFPQLREIKELTNEELAIKWHEIFYDLYSEATNARKGGDHREALQKYRQDQAFVDLVKERGFEDDLILIREAVLHYSLIQSHANFQMEPDSVMREFHNFKEVLFDYAMLIFKDDMSQLDAVNQMNAQYEEKKYVNVQSLFKAVRDYFVKYKDHLSTEKLELIWRCMYFVTRFTGSVHDFFLRSTDLIDEGKMYYEACKEAADIAIEAMRMLPDGLIPQARPDLSPKNKDPEKYLKNARWTLKDQTETWLDVYRDFLDIEIEHILGNDAHDKIQDKTQDKKETAKIQLRNRKILRIKARSAQVLQRFRDGEDILSENVEFALEIKAETTFDDFVRNKISYEEAVKILNDVTKEAKKQKPRMERIMELAQVLTARAALRSNLPNDAQAACDMVRMLREEKGVVIKNSPHIVDKWINVIRAEIQLMGRKDQSEVETQSIDTSDKVNNVVNNETSKQTNDLTLEDLEKIEDIFDPYRLDTDSKRPKLSNRPLDAKIYYILGKTAFAKIKLLGEEFRALKEQGKRKNFIKGHELLKTFKDCQKYLCEAYNLLKDVGYQGTRLFSLIQQKYQRMMDYNDELLNDFAQPAEHEPDMNKEFDMSEVAANYKIQKWTDMMRQLLRNRNLANAKDYEGILNSAVGESVRHIVSTVNRTFIFEESENLAKIHGHMGRDDLPKIEESIKNYKNGKSRTYFYHTENGKVFKVMPIDEEKGRFMVMELDIKMSPASKDLIQEVLKGVNNLLNLNSIMNELERLDPESKEYRKKWIEGLEETNALVEYLFRRHVPTLGHMQEMAFMCGQTAYYLNDIKGFNLDAELAKYAGALHDTGKLGLHPEMQLDIPRRYQDFERDETEQHAIEGIEILRGIPHFIKHFPMLAVLIGSHHVKYGLEPGYPVEAPGDEIKNLPKLLLDKLENPTPEEIEALSFELNEDYIWMARMMNPLDQIQAVRSTDRKYRSRGAMPLGELNGYLNRMAGVDFHPEVVVVIIDMLKRGIIGKTITRSEEEIKKLRQFKAPNRIYASSELVEFVERKQHELERECEIPLTVFLMELSYGVDCNLLMTEQMVGRKLCEYYIQQEGGNKDEGRKRFDKLGVKFFHELWVHIGNKVAPE